MRLPFIAKNLSDRPCRDEGQANNYERAVKLEERNDEKPRAVGRCSSGVSLPQRPNRVRAMELLFQNFICREFCSSFRSLRRYIESRYPFGK